jgi:hypothetical protein
MPLEQQEEVAQFIVVEDDMVTQVASAKFQHTMYSHLEPGLRTYSRTDMFIHILNSV